MLLPGTLHRLGLLSISGPLTVTGIWRMASEVVIFRCCSNWEKTIMKHVYKSMSVNKSLSNLSNN